MLLFTQSCHDPTGRLYILPPKNGEQGHIAYILPYRSRDSELTLHDALSKHSGSFLFSYEPFPEHENTARFVQQVNDFIKTLYSRTMLWLTDVKKIQENTISVLFINSKGTETTENFNALLGSKACRLCFGVGLSIRLSGDLLLLESQYDEQIDFEGRMAPTIKPVRTASIPFTGAQRGCIQFTELFISRHSLSTRMRTGFQFAFLSASWKDRFNKGNSTNMKADNIKYGFYPLLDSVKFQRDYIGFQVSLDFCNVTNVSIDTENGEKFRTYLAFTGHNYSKSTTNQESTLLYTTYITRFGYAVELRPVVADTKDEQQAMLLFTATAKKGVILSPAGDFSLSVMEGTGGDEFDLLCGLSATEIIRFQPGHRVRYSYGPAYAKGYPFPKSSTVGQPLVNPANLLQNRLSTAWMQAVPVRTYWKKHSLPPLQYMAQPVGATLYGKGYLAEKTGNMFFDFKDTSTSLDETSHPFPLLPYFAIEATDTDEVYMFTKADYQSFEKDIIAPIRHSNIRVKHAAAPRFLENGCSNDTYQATTPSGQLVALSGSRYVKVLLGRSESSNESEADISFVNPSDTLIKALQSNQLFLVITNAKWIGKAGGGNGSEPGFCNTTEMDGWGFSADVGEENRYMDYNNVVIIKGRAGSGNSLKKLVSKPEVWTQAIDFASPTYSGTDSPESVDITALSDWLQNYINKSDPSEDPTYKSFDQLVKDEQWTGFLILNANLTKYPKEVQNFLKDVTKQELRAHHLGATTRPASKELKPTDSSAMFGLVYYVHPAYNPNPPAELTPIKPMPGDYDFQPLLMRASFVNGKLADFHARAQLTVSRFFHHKVARMGKEHHEHNTMMIEGSKQRDNEQIKYMFKPSEEYVFLFDDNVMERVEITGIDLHAGRYGLSGFLTYHLLCNKKFDIFSFGLESVALQEKAQNKGLAFSNLYIEPSKDDLLQFEPRNIIFDLNRSWVRTNSLYRAFPLELKGILVNDEGEDLESQGYLPVGAGGQFVGIKGKPWHGLRFNLKFGSLGNLSGNTAIQAELLIAWSPKDDADMGSYNVAIGLKLPDMLNKFKIQGVTELSFNNVLLRKIKIEEHDTFVLHLNPVLLKFLGLEQIPPNGAATLHLFGDDTKGDSSDSLSLSELKWYGIYKTKEGSE